MAHAIVIGAGAIGSHLLPHLARMPQVTALTVIDRDRYDESNMNAQNIVGADVGKSKAMAQVRRVKLINRSIAAIAYQRPVEDLPLGWLRGDVILSCVDSRRARLVINQAAWRLGVPWINSGIDAAGLLVRVQVFMPAPDAPCLECAWDARDYELVEQAYPCQDAEALAATGAPSALGALAASLQAIECEKLLSGKGDELLSGRDVLLDSRHHRHYVTSFRRNPECRMPDHAGWHITPLDVDPAAMTLGELVAMGSTFKGADGGVQMSVAGQSFAHTLTCPRCGDRLAAGHLHRGERRPSPRCRSCECDLTVTGFDLYEAISPEAFPETARNHSLTELGMIDGDVVTFTTTSVSVHLELGGAA